MKIPKIVIVGAGNVGMSCAISILHKQNCCSELVLIDTDEKKVKGEVLDLQNGSAFIDGVQICGGTDYSLMRDADICVITAGSRRIIGENVHNHIAKNVQVFRPIISEINKRCANAIIVVVSNPVDSMTYVAWKLSGAPAEKVIGAGTTVDSARFRQLIAKKTEEPIGSVTGMVLGEHGENAIPIWSSVTFMGGKSNIGLLNDKIEKDKINEEIGSSLREIYNLKGYTNWSIGFAVAEIVEAICSGVRHVFPVSTCATGKYNITEHDCVLSLPVELGPDGVNRVVEIQLSDVEQDQLLKTAADLRCIQKNIVLKNGVAGNTLDVDRENYVGNPGQPKHSPRLHRKIINFEQNDA